MRSGNIESKVLSLWVDVTQVDIQISIDTMALAPPEAAASAAGMVKAVGPLKPFHLTRLTMDYRWNMFRVIMISEITHVRKTLNKEINNNGVYHDITMVHIQPK